MMLAPKLPPGRANRKALQFALDIQRLRSSGYTFSAIRAALLDAGIDVSLATVKREAARRCSPTTGEHRAPAARLGTPAVVPPAAASVRGLPAGTTGREIAEAFFNANPSNPLLSAKDRP